MKYVSSKSQFDIAKIYVSYLLRLGLKGISITNVECTCLLPTYSKVDDLTQLGQVVLFFLKRNLKQLLRNY